MAKLRLDYFLMRGGLFELGDNVNGVDITMDLKTWNSSEVNGADLSMAVKSFAPRKNNGSQPVPDDFPVAVGVGQVDKGAAGDFIWTDGFDKFLWRPDLEKLIEQQIEYDKQQKQSIEELMINAKGNNMPIYTQEMKDAGKAAPVGSKVQIVNSSGLDLEYGEDILGLELTVLSGEILTKSGVPVQAVEYEGIAYCFEIDMIFPFKSQEEIEKDKAKSKRVDELVSNYRHWFVDVKSSRVFFEGMQENGELAEITLPLEAK